MVIFFILLPDMWEQFLEYFGSEFLLGFFTSDHLVCHMKYSHWKTCLVDGYAGEVGRMYEANVDDVGYRLVALYTPLREDGVEGQPVSASTEPIDVGKVFLWQYKQFN